MIKFEKKYFAINTICVIAFLKKLKTFGKKFCPATVVAAIAPDRE
jgi:hypothetical protein